MTTNPIAAIRDNFTDNAIAAAWVSSTTGSATVAETVGQARFTLPSSTGGSHDARYTSAGAYDLTGDGCYINIDTMVATGVAATAFFALSGGAGNVLQWVQASGTLKAQTVLAGAPTDRYSVAWSGTTYKYLRIRESGGNVLFDSSSNGTSWTNRASVAAPFAVTSLSVIVGASCGNVASPGSFRIEDLNIILPALSTNWRWTQVEWPLLERFRSITLAANSGQAYIATSNDGGTWGYFSGPMGSSSGGYNQLTNQSTQAAAEAMAVNLPADGRWDLPWIVECRYIRVYHRSTTGSAYTLREFYPRRLVQSDDVEAESIRAINIAAASITADKLFVLQLSAITADVGTLTSGVINGVTIYGGGQRVTIDSSGLLLQSAVKESIEFEASRIIQWKLSDTTLTGWIGSLYDNSGGAPMVGLGVTDPASDPGQLWIYSNLVQSTVTFKAELGINVGTATTAGTGQIAASGNMALGAAIDTNTRAYIKGAGATSGTHALVVQNSSGGNIIHARNDNAVGFMGATPVTRPTVSGSRGGNAALASVLTALANLGLITDSSSA